MVNLYPNSPPNIQQANHAPSNSYGPITGSMGVKKRLDSSSRIAPETINQTKNVISPSHCRQTSNTLGKNMNTAGSQYTTC
jgi:hypothetical protein